MSKLSDLLNPSPNPQSLGSPPQPPFTGGQESRRDAQRPPPLSNIHANNAPAYPPSLTSPLDALAEIASNQGPMASPSQTPGSAFSPSNNHPATFTQSSPRSTSSHAPSSLYSDFNRAPDHPPVAAFPSDLNKYHHPSTSEARRQSSSFTAEPTPQTLAPFTTAMADKSEAEIVSPQDARQDARVNGDLVSNNGATMLPPQQTMQPKSENTMDIDQQTAEALQDPPEPPAASPPPKANLTGDAPAEHAPVKSEEADHAKITEIKRNASNRASPAATESSNRSSSTKPKPTTPKKRAAPKKGTASAANAKKRKLDVESFEGTPPLPRSATPASGRASKTPAPRNQKQGSSTPARSSSVMNADEDDDEDNDGQVFCICRKGDDHTWMIACDGPCEDWFHGRCVDMDEKDGNLIDKYICMHTFSPQNTRSNSFHRSQLQSKGYRPNNLETHVPSP